MALLISIALVLHYFEHFIPSLAPGAKLGLANIVTLVCLNMFGSGEAMTIVLIRSVLGPILGGSPTGIMYSLAGGTLSCVVMAIMSVFWESVLPGRFFIILDSCWRHPYYMEP